MIFWYTLLLLIGFLIGFCVCWYIKHREIQRSHKQLLERLEHKRFLDEAQTIIDRIVECRNEKLLDAVLQRKEEKHNEKNNLL